MWVESELCSPLTGFPPPSHSLPLFLFTPPFSRPHGGATQKKRATKQTASNSRLNRSSFSPPPLSSLPLSLCSQKTDKMFTGVCAFSPDSETVRVRGCGSVFFACSAKRVISPCAQRCARMRGTLRVAHWHQLQNGGHTAGGAIWLKVRKKASLSPESRLNAEPPSGPRSPPRRTTVRRC